MLSAPRPAYLLADEGYDTDAIRRALRGNGTRAAIPPPSHRKAASRRNRPVSRQRNRIERMIGHLKIDCTLATRYDNLARSFLDAFRLSTIR